MLLTYMNDSLAASILENAGMTNCMMVVTPAMKSWSYKSGDELPLSEEEHRLYRGIVGQLMYVAADRADLKFATKEAARETSQPTQLSMRNVKRIIKYLAGTRHYASVLKQCDEAQTLDMYCDAIWAGCERTRISTAGLTLRLGENAVCSWSKAQSTVALSSCESDFIALYNGPTEAMFAKALFEDCLEIKMKIKLHTDSNAARALAIKQGLGRYELMNSKAFFMQQAVKDGSCTARREPGGHHDGSS